MCSRYDDPTQYDAPTECDCWVGHPDYSITGLSGAPAHCPVHARPLGREKVRCESHGEYAYWCDPCVKAKLLELPPDIQKFIRDMQIVKPS